MNRQEMNTPKKTPTAARQSGATVPSSAPHRRRPDPALLRALRGLMLILAGAIALIGLLLIVLPMFRIQYIEVEGNSYYSDDEIRAASGIKIGEELFAIDMEAVKTGIWKLDYVDSFKVVRSLNAVRIVIEERKNVMYTEFNGKYFSIDREMRVLEESDEPFSSFLPVILPTIASLRVGDRLVFEDESIDLTYLTNLLDILNELGTIASVTSMDVSKKYSVSYVLSESCRIELGSVSRMDGKLTMIDAILERKGGATAALSVIDVTDLQKPTYRVLSSSEMLLGGAA